jgi:hypothetical protein
MSKDNPEWTAKDFARAKPFGKVFPEQYASWKKRRGRPAHEHETLALTDRDRSVFFEALVNPPAPSERLQRAFAARKRRVAD